MLEIVEKFITISGEAPTIGEPIFLIRLSGCNLTCSYCDTTYNNEVNEYISSDNLKNEIIENVQDFPELKVLFTGGEPLLKERQEDIFAIINDLKYINFYIETNGSVPITNFTLPNCYFVADWKSPTSKNEIDFYLDNLKHFRIDKDCIKFVVSKDDLHWLKTKISHINKINPFLPLYVSPQFNKITLEEIADFIIKNKLPLKMSFQFHKIIWPLKDRGV
ncbi:MAG: hypothetical protein A2086_06270 [Spirochaetes bacterium GWD1_27_9]|nr:MAG: hypothetical protein A2Z98_16925 [Spirochaetes bacterium GWB1_27_13]OHD30870.1 MAG: hypothetical protein A2086_06270 [Spirochaetes bacterium GWD1_27_9]